MKPHKTTTSWQCLICDFTYDESNGCERMCIAGTRFDDLPHSWVCPDCGASKSDFVTFE